MTSASAGADHARWVPSEQVDDVLARVDLLAVVGDEVELRRAGADSYKGLCPFHDERTPSFHVRPNAGRVHCFGCGWDGDAVAWIRDRRGVGFVAAVEELAGRAGVELRYTTPPDNRLRPTRARPQRAASTAARKPAAKVDLGAASGPERWVAEYIYRDEDGRPVGRVTRYEQPHERGHTKRFTQQHLGARDRWVKGAPNRRLLYRLPEVRAAIAAGTAIYLAEGEKDAEAAVAAGVCGTTNAGGAASWRDEYAEQLHRADVRLVVDADGAGWLRGLTVPARLAGAARVQVVGPAAGKDLTDHLEAGRRVDELVHLDPAQLLRSLAEVRPDWAAGVVADRLSAEQDIGDLFIDDRDGLLQVLAAARPEHARLLLAARAGAAQGSTERRVIAHPTLSRLPDPAGPLPMARGSWRYDLGEGDRPRGIYTYLDHQWAMVAPLPYIQARIVRRDGTGRRNATDYLLAERPDSPGVIITHIGLRDGSWANELGMPLSDDDKILKATATAIRQHGADAPEREATPRLGDDGRVGVPVPDTLPAGYFQVAPGPRADGLAAWAELIGLAAESPSIALTLGASAAAPFVAALRRQSHIVALYGDSDEGKTITLQLAGGIWGDSIGDGGVVRSWNTSPIGLGRHVGTLGILPPVLDEAGMAPWTAPAEWGKLIYDLCEGAQRQTAETRGPGIRLSMPWHGILISAGNGRLTAGLGAGRFAGVGKRVVDLSTPFTPSAEHAETLTEILPRAYGHAGAEILERYAAADVQALITAAAERIGLPEGGNARTVAKHLHAHAAGAAMLDQIADTGTALYDSACAAAVIYLDQWAAPEHDADRVIALIRDALGREPAMWPTPDEYDEHRQPRHDFTDPGDDGGDGATVRLPQHGINKTLTGLRGGGWIAMFTGPWHEMCAEAGVDESVALRELHTRGVLQVPESRRRRHDWTSVIKATGTSMYKLILPEIDADASDDPATPTESGGGGDDQPLLPPGFGVGFGSVSGSVSGATVPLTCAVSDVSGVSGPQSRVPARTYARGQECDPEAAQETASQPQRNTGTSLLDVPQACTVCGEPAVTIYDDDVAHPGYVDARPSAAQSPTGAVTGSTGPSGPGGSAGASAAPTAAPTPRSEPSEPPSPAIPAPESRPPDRTSSSGRHTSRFRAAAAVADTDGIYLPDGVIEPLPGPLTHAGHLAALVSSLRLGAGGGRSIYAGRGAVVITPALARRLKLPDAAPPLGNDRAAHDSAQHPFLTAAVDDGWSIVGTGLSPWIGLTHGSGKNQTWAYLVIAGWTPVDARANPLLVCDHDTPAIDIARRLQRFADLFGYPWAVSGGVTGMRFLDGLDRAAGRDPGASLCSLPSVCGMVGVETTYAWRRVPDTDELGDGDEPRYLVAVDTNGSHAAQFSSLRLGFGEPEHLTGDAITFDRSRYGLWRIADPIEHLDAPDGSRRALLGDRRLPDPLNLLDTEPGVDGRLWFTTPSVARAVDSGIDLHVTEAWVWPSSRRALEPLYKRIRDARYAARHGEMDVDPAVDAAVKAVYTGLTGKFGDHARAGRQPYGRPDWRMAILGADRAAMHYRLAKAGQTHDRWPVAVHGVDTVLYVSETPDLDVAVPLPMHPTQFGKVKHVATTLLTPELRAALSAPTTRPNVAKLWQAFGAAREAQSPSDGRTGEI